MREYCRFIESAHRYSLHRRLELARTRLLDLYAKGADLPRSRRLGAGSSGIKLERPQKWPGFGRFEYYTEVFDPYVPEEPVGSTLSDDLLDVYHDVREGLLLFRLRTPGEGVRYWRYFFSTHWGDHAIDALRALHRACEKEEEG